MDSRGAAQYRRQIKQFFHCVTRCVTLRRDKRCCTHILIGQLDRDITVDCGKIMTRKGTKGVVLICSTVVLSFLPQLPELSNYINEGGGWPVVISQNLGILTGVSIMLAIALYES